MIYSLVAALYRLMEGLSVTVDVSVTATSPPGSSTCAETVVKMNGTSGNLPVYAPTSLRILPSPPECIVKYYGIFNRGFSSP